MLGSVWVHSTRTSRALTRADMRGEAKQTDGRTEHQPANLHVQCITADDSALMLVLSCFENHEHNHCTDASCLIVP
eukprot:jgi/Chrzof1/1123/Cz01g41030.t1